MSKGDGGLRNTEESSTVPLRRAPSIFVAVLVLVSVFIVFALFGDPIVLYLALVFYLLIWCAVLLRFRASSDPLIAPERRKALRHVIILVFVAIGLVAVAVFNHKRLLILAAQYRHGTILRVLLDIGADVKAGDSYGATALIRAAYNNDATSIEALIKAGADINAKDHDGTTALSWAAFLGNDEAGVRSSGCELTRTPARARARARSPKRCRMTMQIARDH
jgi:hypothetical protein